MSQTVDDRVVKMKFDNDQFNDGVKDTLKSLEDLDKNLKDMDKGSYGANLGEALRGIGFGVDDLSDRFSAWGIVGMKVIEELTDWAIDKGMSMVKALSVDNIMDGWQKFEDVNSSVYAIMNQVTHGESYEQVQRALEKLSWYSDATSFSLTDMVSAMKGFIQQGQTLDDSVDMIMGIGNAITYAGTGAKEGSGAFAVWAKALGGGNLSLRQWQQLSMTYGMTSYQFKEMALAAGEAAGSLTRIGEGIWETNDGLEVSMENFDQTLGARDGKWFDAETMFELFGNTSDFGGYTSGLAEYAQHLKETTGELISFDELVERYNKEVLKESLSDQEEFGLKALQSATVAKTLAEAIDAVKDAVSTQFMQIFQSMFGMVDEAKEYWSSFSSWLLDVFAGPTNFLANAMKIWGELPNEMGGRSSFIQIFRNLAAAADSVVEPFKRAWEAIRGPITVQAFAEKIGKFIKSIESFTESLVLTEEQSLKVQRVWEVLLKIGDFFRTAIGKIVELLKAALTIIKPIIGFLGDLAVAIADVFDVIITTFNLDGNLWEWLLGPTNTLKKIGAQVADTLAIFSNITGDTFKGAIKDTATSIGESFDTISEKTVPLKQGLTDVYEAFKETDSFKTFVANLETVKQNFKTFVETIDEEFHARYLQNGGGIQGTVLAAYGMIKDALKTLYDSFWVMLDNHFSGVKEKIDAFIAWVHEKAVGAIDVVKSVGEKAFSALTSKNPFSMGDDGTSEFEAQMSVWERAQAEADKSIEYTKNASHGLMGIMSLISAGSFTGIMVQLNRIVKDFSGILKEAKSSFRNISKTFGELTDSLQVMQTKIKGDILKSIALAVLELAAAMFIISNIDSEKLGSAVAAMSGLMIGLGALSTSLIEMNIGKTTTTLSKDLTKSNFSKASSGLGGVALQLIALGGAMILFAESMALIAEIPTDKLSAALGALSAIIIELGVFAKLTNTKEGTLGGLQGSAGTQVFKMASGLVVMAQAMKMLAELDDENNSLGKGLGAVGGILTMLFVFQAGMEKIASGNMGDMGSIITLAAGLAALALVIKGYANIPTDELIKGGLAIGAIMGEILLFMLGLSKFKDMDMIKISGALIIFAGALEIMALAMLTFNLAEWDSLGKAAVMLGEFLLVAAGIALIDHYFAGFIPTLIGFGVAVAAFGVGIAGVGIGLAAFTTALTVIGVEGPVLIAGFLESVRVFLIGIVGMKAELIAGLCTIIEVVCITIIREAPLIAETIVQLFEIVFKTIWGKMLLIAPMIIEHWPQIKEAAIKVFSTLKEAIEKYGPIAVEKVKETARNAVEAIKNKVKEMKEKASNFFGGIKEALEEKVAILLAKFGMFILDMIQKIKDKKEEIKTEAKNFISKIGEGIDSVIEDIKTKAGEIVDNFIGGIMDKIDSIKEVGANIIRGLTGGLGDSDANSGLMSKIAGVGSSLISKFKTTLGIASPSKETEILGRYLMEGFVVGVDESTFEAEEEASLAAEKILEAFGDPLAEMIDKLETEVEMNPTITPVLDLSQFDDGLNKMNTAIAEAKAEAATIGAPTEYVTPEKVPPLLDAQSGVNYILGKGNVVRGILNSFAGTSMDLASAAEHGFWTEDMAKLEDSFASRDIDIVFNQTINSPNPIDPVETYRQTNKAVKNIVAVSKVAGSNEWS